MNIEAMKQALEALEHPKLGFAVVTAREILEKAIAEAEKHYGGQECLEAWKKDGSPIPQPKVEQEPVAYWDGKESVVFMHDEIYTPNWTDYWTIPLYTHPQPKREPLKFEKVYELWLARFDTNEYDDVFMNFARAIEAAHGIKE